MNDMETLKEMLEKAGIEYEFEGSNHSWPRDDDLCYLLTVYGGYSGFATQFDFDSKGKLIRMGAFE